MSLTLLYPVRNSLPFGEGGVGFIKHYARKPSRKGLHDEDKSLPLLMLLMPISKIISFSCRLFYYYLYS